MGFCFDARPKCCKCEVSQRGLDQVCLTHTACVDSNSMHPARKDVDASLQEIKKERSCTDVLFFLGLVLSWVLAIWIVARTPEYGGDPDK